MKRVFFIIAFILFGFPVHSQEKVITTSDGVKLHVKVEGQGTPLLYIHGGPGSGSYWLDHFFGDFLEQNFTVVYLDQRGVGRSSSPADGNFSMDRMALDFEEVRKNLGFKNWLTMGHSFGGILQMGYAEKFPEAIKGLLMVNCTINIQESFCASWNKKAAELLEEKEEFPCTTDHVALMNRLNYLGSKLREKDLFWKMAYADKKNEAIMGETFAAVENWNYDFGNAALQEKSYWKNFKDSASSIQQPVLFFYGTNDWMVGPQHYADIKFPNMLLWENEGGHMPFMESKANLQNAILTYKKSYNL